MSGRLAESQQHESLRVTNDLFIPTNTKIPPFEFGTRDLFFGVRCWSLLVDDPC